MNLWSEKDLAVLARRGPVDVVLAVASRDNRWCFGALTIPPGRTKRFATQAT